MINTDRIAEIIHVNTQKVEYGPQELVDVCPVRSLINTLADYFEHQEHDFVRAEFLLRAKGKT